MSRPPYGDLVAVALPVAGFLMSRVVSYEAPFAIPVLPIIAVAYFGGLRGGAIATATSTILAIGIAASPVRIATLVVAGVLAAVGGELLQCSRHRARRSEQMYNDSFHASPVPLVLSQLESGRVVDANDAYTRLTGWTRAEMIALSAEERAIADPAESERIRRWLARDRIVRDVPVQIRPKSGDPREARLSAVLLDFGGVEHCLTTVLDITEVKRAESSARAFEQRFRELADSIDEVFWINTPELTKCHYISPAYERVWGRSCANLYASPRDWVEAVHPEDRERVIAEALSPELDFRIVHPDGGVRWIHNRTFPVRDASGAVVRIAGVAADVTERRRLEEQLQHTQKMESLGRLAGGVAHDFNNILAVISTNTSILTELVPEIGESRELFDELAHAVARATGLTRQLLAFSRKQRIEPVVLDVNAIVTETRKMLRRMIGEDIQLETSLDPELAHVRMDAGHLVQVLMNLAVNARDAMPNGGKLVLQTRNVSGDARRVAITIRDSGQGMTDDVRARIFEPFFTTKGAGKGTGMGLAVVHGIVEQNGGDIAVETAVGRGTTFRIELPAVDAPVDPLAAPARAVACGGETVLVVDDDPHVRRATSRALRSRGYRALEASDARAALEVLDRTPIDLLVTDIVMPGMNGHELAEVARCSRPELKVLYTSGYIDDEVVSGGAAAGIELLEKPFRGDALAAKVREVLGPIG